MTKANIALKTHYKDLNIKTYNIKNFKNIFSK